MASNSEDLVRTFAASIRTHGVVKSIEAFRNAMAEIADPTDGENSEGMAAYIAMSEMDEVTGSWE